MKKLTLLIIFIAFQSYADNHNAVSNTQSPIIKTSTTNHPVMGLQQLQLKNQEIQFQLQLQSMKNLQDKLAENNKYQDLRKNVLSSRESSIDSWLGVIGIFLTVLSVFFTALGVFGFFVAKNKIKEFDNLNKEAKLALEEIKVHKEKARTDAKTIAELNNPTKEPSDEILKEVKQSGTKLEKIIVKARILELEEKTEAAIASWKEIVAIAKYEGNTDQQAAGCLYLGYLYGNYDIDHKESLIFSKQAIEIKPDMCDAYNNMGMAYDELKEYQKAINAYQKAIEIKPDYDIAYNNMGNAYNKLKEYQKAINAYQKAIEITPNYNSIYTNLFKLQLFQGQTFDPELIKQHKTYFKNARGVMIKFDMLTIFKAIDTGNTPNNWQDKFTDDYQNISFTNWKWNEIEDWIKTKTHHKQELQSALTFFKAFNQQNPHD